MNNIKNLGALLGLVGAVNNNGKTENTDEIVRMALLSADSDEILQMIHEEKFVISPNCRTCTSPCGNTSDCELNLNEQSLDEVIQIKIQLVDVLCKYVSNSKEELPDEVYTSLSYLGYNLKKEAYVSMIEKLKALM